VTDALAIEDVVVMVRPEEVRMSVTAVGLGAMVGRADSLMAAVGTLRIALYVLVAKPAVAISPIVTGTEVLNVYDGVV
jgi:hypothetical protein